MPAERRSVLQEGATSPPIVLFEDQRAAQLGPLALTRPVFDLVVGAFRQRERIAALCGAWPQAARVRPALRPWLAEAGMRDVAETPAVPARLLVNARWLPQAEDWGMATALPLGAQLRSSQGDLLALHAGEDLSAALALLTDAAGAPERPDGPVELAPQATILRDSWDLVSWHEALLGPDVQGLLAGVRSGDRSGFAPIVDEPGAGVFVHGDGVVAHESARITPPVFLDSTSGPVVIEEDAQVGPFSHLTGPMMLARGTHFLGGSVTGTYLGPGCRVRGEVTGSVFLGWSNKAHDGFVGHCYIGEWVNLGAMTTTSNLKNTYGAISMGTAAGPRPTGRIKLGSLIGDHARTAIGTLLAGGSQVGVAVNLFGAEGPAGKWLPSFLWGVGQRSETYDLARFLAVAERVLGRRERSLTPGQREILSAAFAETSAERRDYLDAAAAAPDGPE